MKFLISVFVVLLLNPLVILYPAESAASFDENFETKFDANRFFARILDKISEVRDGVL